MRQQCTVIKDQWNSVLSKRSQRCNEDEEEGLSQYSHLGVEVNSLKTKLVFKQWDPLGSNNFSVGRVFLGHKIEIVLQHENSWYSECPRPSFESCQNFSGATAKPFRVNRRVIFRYYIFILAKQLCSKMAQFSGEPLKYNYYFYSQ